MKKKKWYSYILLTAVLALIILPGCSSVATETSETTAPAIQRDMAVEKLSFQVQDGGLNGRATQATHTPEHTIPEEFSSETELLLWLGEDDVSELPGVDKPEDWVNKARLVQLDALLDGYLVNVDYDYDSSNNTLNVYNTAFIGGSVYFWDPETDEVEREIILGPLDE